MEIPSFGGRTRNSYMSTAWSSPGARAIIEPSPEQSAARRQPIDISTTPRMLLACSRTRLKCRTKDLHPGDTPELQRYRQDMEDAVILLRRNTAARKSERPGAPKRIQAVGGERAGETQEIAGAGARPNKK